MECGFPICVNEETDDVPASVDYGQFLSFLEDEDGQITCLQQGHGQRVVYDSPCIPLAPPSVRTPFDDITRKTSHPLRGTVYKTFMEVSYLYTSHPEARLPLPLACDLLSQSNTSIAGQGSALTFVPCAEQSAHDTVGYLLFASGPDLCTLTVGSLHVSAGSQQSPSDSDSKSFTRWSCDHAPLSVRSLEAYAVPSKIRQLHMEHVQGQVILCCRGDYHVTLFEVHIPPRSSSSVLKCVCVYASDSIISDAKLSPYIAGELVVVSESGRISMRRKSGQVSSLPSYDQSFTLCCYGSHPRSLILATPTNLFHFDNRDRSTRKQLISLLDCRSRVTCIARDIAHPFRVIIATDQTLYLLDIRQPNHHLLAVQHHLTTPPSFVTLFKSSQGLMMVLLTSASSCESVIVYYNGHHSPPYFALRPHTVAMPRDQVQEMRGLSFSASLSLVEWRFSQLAAGSVLFPVAEDKFGAVVLTSLGDMFYQLWHCSAPGEQLSRPAHDLSPSLQLGYSLWLREAGQQEQELICHRELPTAKAIDMDPLLKYLACSPQNICLSCYHVHAQHFSHLQLEQYLSSCPAPATNMTQMKCLFCSSAIEPKLSGQCGQIKTLTNTSGSGLDSLRQSCSVRQPSNEFELSLVRGWPIGGAELQRNLLDASDSPAVKVEMEEEDYSEQRLKATPTPSKPRLSGKIRRIGF